MADITVTEHLLLHQKRSPQATGQFTGLLYDLILSGKTISRRINKAGLLDILGGTGEVNVQGENVQKMDSIANRILLYRMERCGALCAMGSEEEPELVRVGPEFPRGDYILIFDPLDGSSNIDVNINVGTIFSILRRPAGSTGEVSLDEVLQPGIQQVAAGYILYGPSTMLVFSTGQGVHGFTLDPGVGEFLLSHPDMRIPEQGHIYSVNEGMRPRVRPSSGSIPARARKARIIPPVMWDLWWLTSTVRCCTAASTCIRRTRTSPTANCA